MTTSRAIVAAAALLIFAAGARSQAEPPADATGPAPADPARTEQRADAAWSKLSLREKQHLLKLHRALKNMPPEERALLHNQLERFQQMTPAERDQLRQNRERWKKMTPEEREHARRLFRERRQRLEEQWRQNHPGEDPPPHGARPPPATEPATQPPNEERNQE